MRAPAAPAGQSRMMPHQRHRARHIKMPTEALIIRCMLANAPAGSNQQMQWWMAAIPVVGLLAAMGIAKCGGGNDCCNCDCKDCNTGDCCNGCCEGGCCAGDGGCCNCCQDCKLCDCDMCNCCCSGSDCSCSGFCCCGG